MLPEAESERAAGSFEDFYRTHAAGLRRYAVVVAGRDQADDACQEAWLRLWRAWGTADPDRLAAGARRVVRACCLDVRRSRPTGPAAAPAPAWAPEPEEVVVSRAEAEAMARLIRRLPGQLRQTLVLREVMDQSYAEIAATLDIPVGTVMSRLHTARRRLARRRAE